MPRPQFSAPPLAIKESTYIGQGSVYGTMTVDTVAVEVKAGAVAVDGRMTLSVQTHPNNTANIYCGFDETVSPTNWAFILGPFSSCEITLDKFAARKVFAISEIAGQKMGVIEGAN